MKYIRQRISDYVDEPKGVWKYLMKSSGSDYLSASTSRADVEWCKAYGKKHLGYKYYVTKLSVWPHKAH